LLRCMRPLVALSGFGHLRTEAVTEAAKELVKALTGPVAAPVIKKHGMEPG